MGNLKLILFTILLVSGVFIFIPDISAAPFVCDTACASKGYSSGACTGDVGVSCDDSCTYSSCDAVALECIEFSCTCYGSCGSGCSLDSQCSITEYCNGGSCDPVSCPAVCEYVDNHACGDYNSGVPCPGGECDGNGNCVECLSDNDCPGTEYCKTDFCLPVVCDECTYSDNNHGCTNWGVGAPCSGGSCDGSGSCVECTNNNDCSGSEYCSGNSCVAVPCAGECNYVSSHVCYNYNSGTSCSGGVCDGSNNCVECLDNSDCSGSEYCSGGSCAAVSCPGVCEYVSNHACSDYSSANVCSAPYITSTDCYSGDYWNDAIDRYCSGSSGSCSGGYGSGWYQTSLIESCGTTSNTGGQYCSGGDIMQDETQRGCSGGCYANLVSNLVQDCGVDSNSGGLYCSGGDVMQNINDRGCSGSSCYSNVVATLSQDCGVDSNSGGLYCSGGDVMQNINDRGCSGSSCYSNVVATLSEDCGVDSNSGGLYCSGDNIMQNINDRGCSGSSCFSNVVATLNQDCSATGQICSGATCVDCAVSADCSSGEYCAGGTNTCIDLPTCAEANSGTGYNTQESTEDLWGDCSSSYNSCSNQYTRTGPDGLCTGGAYSCKTSGLSTSVTVGDVCDGGVNENPSANTDCGTGAQACSCDTTIDCNDNSCGATKYYEGFSGSSCTTTGRVSYGTWSASSGYSISGSSDATGTTCAQNVDYCSTADLCYSYGSYYSNTACNGAGSCNIGYSSTVEPDSLQAACECEVAGTQDTCTDGETDCWVNANSECCGDDNLADDWITTGGGCVDGAWKDGAECLSDVDCAGGETCDLGTNLCVLACPTLGADKFTIQNSTGSTCFEVDTAGNSLIYGTLTQSCSTIPPVNSFILKGSGTVYGWISDSNCAMCVYGTASALQSISYSAPAGFYVKNTNGTYVMKWDNTGGLNFAGNVCYNSGAWTGL